MVERGWESMEREREWRKTITNLISTNYCTVYGADMTYSTVDYSAAAHTMVEGEKISCY